MASDQALYLVTGGGGFIGSNLVHRLVELGLRVRVLDNFSTGRRENLAGLEGRVEVFEGDLRSPEDVRAAVLGVTWVLHQGALPSVARSVEDPFASVSTNAMGTLNVLEAARAAGVERVVYASSSSVYGEVRALPKREEMRPLPLSPYAAGKLSGEHLCRAFTRSFGLDTISLRYFNVFGPRQDPHSEYAAVIPRFIAAALSGEPVTVYGDGEQSRDFTHVNNVVTANLLALSATQAAAGMAFNIGCGEQCSVNGLAALIEEITGRPLERQYQPARVGDVRHSVADVSRAAALLGYQPTVSLREGLEQTVAWYAAQAVPTVPSVPSAGCP